MARVDISQVDAIDAFTRHLRDSLELNDRTCYQTIEPMAPPNMPVGAPWWVSVSPGDSSFDEALQAGGGQMQLSESMGITVTGYTRIRLDSTDHDEKLFGNAVRGLFVTKQKILQAVAQVDISAEVGEFLRSYVIATGADRPGYDADKSTGWQSINFRLEWDWDLR